MTNEEIVETLERVQDLLSASVTNEGKQGHAKEYEDLTKQLYQVQGMKEAMPPFVRRCRELGQFWNYIKTEEPQLSSYKSRRQFVVDAFRPLVQSFKDGKSPNAQAFFPKGSSHDAYTHIRNILQTAKTSLLIIDGYMDSTIYTVMSTLTGHLGIKILTSKVPNDFGLEGKKFSMQHQSFTLELRKTKDFHDRFIVVDNQACYFLGASIKDAGDKSFSIVPLKDPPIVQFFLNYATQVWNAANPIPP